MDHGLCLELVGGDDPDEIAEAILVCQITTRGAVTDLRDVEQLEQILHLDADGARTRSDDTYEDLIALPTLTAGAVAFGARS